MIPPEVIMSNTTAPGGESAALDNPLPDPVTGRRSEMEFPITDFDEPLPDGRTQDGSSGEPSGGDCENPEDCLPVEAQQGDDFDYPVDESDDFDI